MKHAQKSRLSPEEIKQIRRQRKASIVERVTVVIGCELCPEVKDRDNLVLMLMRPTGKHTWTASAMERGAAVVEQEDWIAGLAAWLDAYWTAHGHGPTWSHVCNTDEVWPAGVTKNIRRAALHVAAKRKITSGSGIPFSLRIRRENAS